MKAKAFFLTLFLSVAAVSLWAQEKYEYAMFQIVDNMVLWNDSTVKIFDFNERTNWYSQAFAKLEELSAQGWELVTVTELPLKNKKMGYSMLKYHLRRKKN